MCSNVGVMMLILLTGIAQPRLIEVNDKEFEKYASDVDSMKKTVDAMKKIMAATNRQVLLQQLFVEERIRSDGDSGVKQVRVSIDGTRNYHSPSHASGSFMSIHDHSNNIRTVGMGEFIGVLNGVEFRTRHNDYRLYMPSTTSKDWHAKENIPFPDVPPAVLQKKTLDDQIDEMREWFKAWRDQNNKTRDYRKYFKPVLCYLEGVWTTSTKGKVEEPFESDRHFVDASSWFDLQEKIRFTSYTGRKDNLENFSFLPTTMINVTEEGYPEFAQWNYRIMCHPVSRDLPLNHLRVVDELGSRLSFKKTLKQHSMSRAARFQINPFDKDWAKSTEGRNNERWGLLDSLMSEIPGKDNYRAYLEDEAFDMTAYSNDPKRDKVKLNAARYHRYYTVERKGAMGTSTRHRGFSDQNLFMAMNTQPNVAEMSSKTCKWQKIDNKWKKVCKTVNQRWSYAIPLEIIYLTPLSKWNPHNIEYKGDAKTDLAKTVERGGRYGGMRPHQAYNGTHSRKYYITPVEFFSGSEVGKGAADTTRNTVGVLDKKGNVHKCKASGTRIFLPNIVDVGIMRQRFPIAPVHGEGSSVWKELEATKDLVLDSSKNGYIFREPIHNCGPKPTAAPQNSLRYEVQNAQLQSKVPGPHTHHFYLTPKEIAFLKEMPGVHGHQLTVITNERAGHTHRLQIYWDSRWKAFYILKCDRKQTVDWRVVCADRHPRKLVLVKE